MRRLDKELITTSLQRLLKDGYTYADIHRESGVNNLGRIATGVFGTTTDTWLKLHEAFPNYIPPPRYETGEDVLPTKKKKRGKTQPKGVTPWSVPSVSSAKLRMFFKLFHRHQSDAVLDGLITYLKDVDTAAKRVPKT